MKPLRAAIKAALVDAEAAIKAAQVAVQAEAQAREDRHRLLPGEAFRSFMGESGRAFACDARIQGVVPATKPSYDSPATCLAGPMFYAARESDAAH